MLKEEKVLSSGIRNPYYAIRTAFTRVFLTIHMPVISLFSQFT